MEQDNLQQNTQQTGKTEEAPQVREQERSEYDVRAQAHLPGMSDFLALLSESGKPLQELPRDMLRAMAGHMGNGTLLDMFGGGDDVPLSEGMLPTGFAAISKEDRVNYIHTQMPKLFDV